MDFDANSLRSFLAPEDQFERVGFVLKNGDVVEVKNICPDPDGFEVSGEDLVRYEHDAWAFWHTHPRSDALLSVADHESFLAYPHLVFFIVGTDEVAKYIVRDGAVLVDG